MKLGEDKIWGFPGGSDDKESTHTMQETWVRPLVWKDPLEKEMATHSNTLAWKIPCRKESDMTEQLSLRQVALVVKNLPASVADTGDMGLIPGS